jgi:hypothetical protein
MMSEESWAPGAPSADRFKCEQVADDKTGYNMAGMWLGPFYLLRRDKFKAAYKECMARRGYTVSSDGQPVASPSVQGPPVHPAPTPVAPEPSVSTVPLNVWKTAPIGEDGAMVRYRLIEKGSPLDTCTPPLVSVRVYEDGVRCVPAELVK